MITESDAPQYYAVKFVTGGPRCGCKVWYGAPLDPITGEPLDRAPRWHCEINGQLQDDPHRIIMLVGNVGYVKGEQIDQAEYEYLLSVRAWAVENDPSQPEASPREAIDLNKLRPIF
jgi:hypothetical protein